MVRHVILWTLDEKFSEEEKVEIKANMKLHLESLVGKVPGLCKMNIYTEKLASSTADVMMDSLLEDADALKGYATHPEHVAVADTYVRPYTATRACLDFEV